MMTDEEIDKLLAEIKAQQAEDQLKAEQKKRDEERRKLLEAENSKHSGRRKSKAASAGRSSKAASAGRDSSTASGKSRTAAGRSAGRSAGRKRKNLILNILLVFFAVVFIVSGIYLFKYYYDSRQNKKLVSSLKEMIEEDSPSAPSDPEHPNYSTSDAKVPEYVTVGDRRLQRKFRNLYEKNQDFVGWLTIDGTSVDYPVMYTPQQEQKYLRKNFEGDYALAGTLFIAADSDPFRPSTNVIIYGHNMQDGSMFSDLLKYKDESFYQEHKLIRFDTLDNNGIYEVIAAFPGQVLHVGEEGFRYYDFYDAKSQEEFDNYVTEVRSRCTYRIPVTASYGDSLITLSTCENSGASEGKRYVVVARRVN